MNTAGADSAKTGVHDAAEQPVLRRRLRRRDVERFFAKLPPAMIKIEPIHIDNCFGHASLRKKQRPRGRTATAFELTARCQRVSAGTCGMAWAMSTALSLKENGRKIRDTI